MEEKKTWRQRLLDKINSYFRSRAEKMVAKDPDSKYSQRIKSRERELVEIEAVRKELAKQRRRK